MKRLPEIQDESAQDSFLDVIINLVGVIIILTMLVTSWATREVATVTTPPADQSVVTAPQETATYEGPQEADLNKARLEALAARQELEKLATQLVRIRDEATEFDNNRVTLAMHRKVIEEDIAKRRDQLDADKQQEFDVQRQIGEAQIKLDLLTKQQMGLLSAPETVAELESLPTPLARDVNGDAMLLRVSGGLVSVVPLKELMAEASLRTDAIRRRLQEHGKVAEVFGPLDGYRIRLVVIRQRAPVAVTGPIAGQLERSQLLTYVEVLPVGEIVGQEVEVALAPGGSVYNYLQANRHETPTVAIFLQTDSFKHSAALKKALWEMGLAVTMLPVAPDDPLRIGFGNTNGIGMSAQ